MTMANADLHYNRARVFEFLMETESAIREYQLANKTDPSLNSDRDVARIKETTLTALKALKNKVLLGDARAG